MQKWEYRIELAGRRMEGTLKDSWAPWEKTFEFKELGRDGWELVAAYPRSTLTGERYAGCTSEVEYVFKRPIEDDA